MHFLSSVQLQHGLDNCLLVFAGSQTGLRTDVDTKFAAKVRHLPLKYDSSLHEFCKLCTRYCSEGHLRFVGPSLFSTSASVGRGSASSCELNVARTLAEYTHQLEKR